MIKQILLIFSIILLGFSGVSAQKSASHVEKFTGTVLNGKAVKLEKPAYPPAARAVGAQGSVNVKVLIDEEGNVISAEAVSGHPLLQQAAVQAAQQSKFAPTSLSGQPVKVTGIIVYNFVAPERTTNWMKIGYDLTSVQQAPSLVFLDTNSIDKVFQADWTTEKEQLKRLGEIKQAENSNVSPPTVISERQVSDTSEKAANGTTVRKVIVERAIKSDNPPDAEQVAISQSLTASLQSRLGGDALNSWRFNTGVSLSRALSKLRFTNERESVIDAFRSQIQSAPSEVAPEKIADLQKMLRLLEIQKPTAEDRAQVGQLLSNLLRN